MNGAVKVEHSEDSSLFWRFFTKSAYYVQLFAYLYLNCRNHGRIKNLWLFSFQMMGQDKKECPPPPPMPQCIGPGYFVVLIVAQTIMLVGYICYKNQKEAAAKKFF